MAATAVGMNNLTTLIKRLEAATSRLEDIAASTHGLDESTPAIASSSAKAASTPNLPVIPETPSLPTPRATSAPLPPFLADIDALLENELKAFVAASANVDPVLVEQSAAVAECFSEHRKILHIATKAKKPDMGSTAFGDLMKDLVKNSGVVMMIKDKNFTTPWKFHVQMVEGGVWALNWPFMPDKPADYVGQSVESAKVFGNKITAAANNAPQSHVKFARSYYALLDAYHAYVKKHYPTGLTWNASGVDLAQAMRDTDASSTPPVASGAPPPPPPPLPKFDNAPPPPPLPSASQSSSGGDMGAVFDQLNRGSDVTAGLRKVDKSQMTHKNPSLRAGSTVPGGDDISRSKSPGPQVKPKPNSMRQASNASTIKKEGSKTLDGNKWIIENFDSPSAPIEVDVTISQSILISRCKNTTIIFRGKANALSVNDSSRTQILVDTLVSAVDVIKSPNFAIQITGSAPTILLDQVDGASIYLGKSSLSTEVFTSKCSSVNIVMPPVKEEDDGVEVPLPEQIRTYVKDGKLVSEIVEHSG